VVSTALSRMRLQSARSNLSTVHSLRPFNR
jgi:hypothetical protein